jgi:hypothetical protein
LRVAGEAQLCGEQGKRIKQLDLALGGSHLQSSCETSLRSIAAEANQQREENVLPPESQGGPSSGRRRSNSPLGLGLRAGLVDENLQTV